MAEIKELVSTKGNTPFSDLAKKMNDRVAKEKVEKNPVVELKSVVEEVKQEIKPDVKIENKVETKVEEKSVPEKNETKAQIKEEDKKAETKFEEKPVVQQSKSKQWWEDEKDSATIDNNIGKKEDKKNEVDYATKLKEYEDILADQEVQALLSAKKAGKNILSFAEELKGTDASKLTPSDLYKMRLTNAGATPEEIEEALTEFSSKPKWQQNEETQSIRAKIESERQENLKRIIGNNSEFAEKQKQIINKATAELDQFVSDLNDKDFYGVKITSDIANGLKDAVMNEITYRNSDGTVNIPLSIEQALWHKYKKIVMKANIAKAKAETTEQILNEVTRPSLNNTSDKRLPVDDKDDAKDAREGYLARKREGIRK